MNERRKFEKKKKSYRMRVIVSIFRGLKELLKKKQYI